VAPLQTVAGAVHIDPQHGWPDAPHPPQLPPVQTPKPAPHELACDTQAPFTQQPPPAQPLLIQQG
jgi:hypothetical protein